MIFLIFLVFMIIWAVVAYRLGQEVASAFEKGRLYAVAIAIAIVLLPFAEEIFIAGSFYTHCKIYGGITKLNPVSASVVGIRKGWAGVAVLEHPAIDTIKYLENSNEEIGPERFGVNKSRDQKLCTDPINQRWAGDSNLTWAVRVRHTLEQGFCYQSVALANNPKIELGAELNVVHERFTWLLPYEVTESRSFVFDTAQQSDLSSFSKLSIMPGWVRQNIWPHARPYKCPAKGQNLVGNTFPYRSEQYKFLQQAVQEVEQ